MRVDRDTRRAVALMVLTAAVIAGLFWFADHEAGHAAPDNGLRIERTR